ncbi:MAG: tetratricopeptide repeat protein [Melioribacteraceae bacterium]|nr:tetratricopeptide repeat protein [Melioribacteraceae bacterium]
MKIFWSLFLFFLVFISNNIYTQNSYTPATQHKLDSLQSKIDIARNDDDTLNMCRAYYKMGQYIDGIGEKARSYVLLDSAMFFAEKLGNARAIASISNSLAANYSSEGKYEKAIEVFKSAAGIFLEIKDTAAYSKVLLNLALEYVETSQFEEAMKYELDALRFCEKADSSNICYFLQSISELYYTIGNREKWKEYLLLAESLSWNEKYADKFARLEILNEMGALNMSENNYVEAEKSYRQLYKLSEEFDYQHGMAIALTNLVPVFEKLGKKSEVIDAAQKSIELNIKNNRIANVIYGKIQLGEIYRKYKNYSKAVSQLKSAQKLVNEKDVTPDLTRLFKQFYLTYKELGNNRLALNYFEKYSEINDSLLNIESKKAIAELETKFQVEKKEHQIEFLNKENEHQNEQLANQRLLILAASVAVVLFGIIIFYVNRQRKNKLKIESLKAQQKMLLSQMNPHFLFNSLTAIQNFLLDNDSLASSDYLAEFARLMRLILESSRKDFISIKDDLNVAQFYLSLQKLRFNNSFNFQVISPEDANISELQIPPMLSQPFIENAIEHGMKKMHNAEGNVIVDYSINDNYLQIKISDNGDGFDPDKKNQNQKHISYATKITEERISNYNNSNKRKIEMTISSKNNSINGTIVTFTIPILNGEVVNV